MQSGGDFLSGCIFLHGFNIICICKYFPIFQMKFYLQISLLKDLIHVMLVKQKHL